MEAAIVAAYLWPFPALNKFETKIQTPIGSRVFQFTLLHYSGNKVYHVAVFGQFFNVYFTMIYTDDGWQFQKPHLIREWIQEVKDELINAIEMYNAN